MKYRNKELLIDKSVNRKCLERVQGLLSQFSVSEVVNCINHLNNDSSWLQEHIQAHQTPHAHGGEFTVTYAEKELNKDHLDALIGPFGKSS